jgi:hypothetical protein
MPDQIYTISPVGTPYISSRLFPHKIFGMLAPFKSFAISIIVSGPKGASRRGLHTPDVDMFLTRIGFGIDRVHTEGVVY